MKHDDQLPACSDNAVCSCSIEAMVTVDGRGQLVLPKEVRDRAGISAGDRLAVLFWEKEGGVCCITLIKAAHFDGMVRSLLRPMMENISSGKQR